MSAMPHGDGASTWELPTTLPPQFRGDTAPEDLELTTLESAVRERLLDFVTEGTFEPPPLPAIAQQIHDACSSGDASANLLAEIAHRDSFVAGRVLRLANTAHFHRGSSARTLHQAIVRIGQNELRNLVLTVVLKGQTFNVPEARDFALCWRHSLACALASSLLASEIGWVEPHRAFLAGLLHDVGKAVVLHAFNQFRVQYPDEVHDPAMVVSVAQALHTEVGGDVARLWRLDEGLSEVITHHHRPVDAALSEKLCSLVSFGDAITAEVGLSEEARLPHLATHPVRVFSQMDEDKLYDILQRVMDLMAQYDSAV